ncbi:MAG: ribosome-associated translation inhibitor RaiA [bacterium]
MELRITHRTTPLTEAMKTYITEKFMKFEKRVDQAEVFDVIYTAQVQNKGVNEDHKIEVMCKSKGKFVKVEKEGADFYNLVDNIEKVLRMELNKVKNA